MSELSQQQLKFLWEWSLKGPLVAIKQTDRQSVRVKEQTIKFDGTEFHVLYGVECVANDGVTDGLQVHTDLMRATGVDANFEVGGDWEAIEHVILGHRIFSFT